MKGQTRESVKGIHCGGTIFCSCTADYDIMAENLFVLHAKKVQVLKINVSNSKLRLSIQFKYGSLS